MDKWILSKYEVPLQCYLIKRYMSYKVDQWVRQSLLDRAAQEEGKVYINNDPPMEFEEWVIRWLNS